jgi:hypothetical protein
MKLKPPWVNMADRFSYLAAAETENIPTACQTLPDEDHSPG